MRKAILILGAIIIFSSVSFAQTQNDSVQQLQSQILNLEKLNSKLLKQVIVSNSNIEKLERRLTAAMDSLGTMKKELAITNNNIQSVSNNLGLQIQQLGSKTNSDLSTLNGKVSKNTLFLILAVFLIVTFIAIIFIWLKNKLTREKTEMLDKIKSTYESLREERIKPDNLLLGLLESQNQSANSEQQTPVEIDHALALKVADEIIRIQKNLSNIDPETKGLKQIEFALERIQDYFTEYGYEMVELLNKPYDQGMRMSAKFRTDSSVEQGKQIITRIIKPQINYNGVIIQPAEVEVSVGE